MATPMGSSAPGAGQAYPIVRGNVAVSKKQEVEAVPSVGGALVYYLASARRLPRAVLRAGACRRQCSRLRRWTRPAGRQKQGNGATLERHCCRAGERRRAPAALAATLRWLHAARTRVLGRPRCRRAARVGTPSHMC
jgi:hypothetical protein